MQTVTVCSPFVCIAPSGFGTADMLIIGKDENGRGLLHVCDFKTGKGVFVDADHNSQMMLYALGGLAAYGFLYDIEIVRMSIIQPRLDNISTFECSRQELVDWGESIKPTALLAFEGKGEQHPGDWCRFCRAKPVCKACADEALLSIFGAGFIMHIFYDAIGFEPRKLKHKSLKETLKSLSGKCF